MTEQAASLGVEAVQLLDAITDRLVVARQRYGGRAAAPESDGDSTEHPADDAQPSGGAEAAAGPADDAQPSGGAEAVAGPGADGTARAGAGTCPTCGHHPAQPQTCTSCPICAAQAMLRGERPEAAAKLIDGALAVLQVLRGLVDGAGQGTPPVARSGEAGRGSTEDGGPAEGASGTTAADGAGPAGATTGSGPGDHGPGGHAVVTIDIG